LAVNRESESQVIGLLSTFRNVENLAIWSCLISPKILEAMDDLPLYKLSVFLGNVKIDKAIKYRPTFKNLTHLELIGSDAQTWDDCKTLVEFPGLTHLCFDCSIDEARMPDLLEDCPLLRVLIVFLVRNYTIKSHDPKFLVLLDDIDWTIDWERSANGQIGLWELADIIVEARRGEVHFLLTHWLYSSSLLGP
jgi:hypothetical protein